MKSKVLNWDSKEGIAILQLESGEKVIVGGKFINKSTFTCYATIKNMIGLPIKRIWKFAFTSSTLHYQNVVHLDFYKYPPFYTIVGYALQFASINEMRQAQNRHTDLLDQEIAVNTLLKMGLIKET